MEEEIECGELAEAERRRSASSDGGEVAVRAVCRTGAKDLILGQRLKVDGLLELRREPLLNDSGSGIVGDVCVRAVC